MEEFGVLQTDVDQVTAYTQWYKDVIADGLTGDLIWQAGSSFTTGLDDGYEVRFARLHSPYLSGAEIALCLQVYPGTDVYEVVTEYAAALKARG